MTVVSAVAPARRATHIPPVAALRDDVALPESSLRRRALVGTTMLAAGIAAMAAGLMGDAGILWVGLGALGIFLGVAMLSPFLSRPVVGGVGSLLPRLWGPIGRLARENARRNPRRTAATASALMVGLALVSAGGVLGASIVKSANGIIDRSVGADFIVTAANFMPIPSDVAKEVSSVDGVDAVTSFRSGQAQVGKSVVSLQGVTADTVDRTLKLKVVTGDVGALADEDTMLVDKDVAKDKGWTVGDRVPTIFGKTGEDRARGRRHLRPEPDRRRLPDRARHLRRQLLPAAGRGGRDDHQARRRPGGGPRPSCSPLRTRRTWRSATRASSRTSSASRSTRC